MTARARQQHLRLSASHDASGRLGHIGAPTLVLHGTDDALTPAVNASILAARIPTARLHLVEHGRHGFFDEFSAQVTQVIDGHLYPLP